MELCGARRRTVIVIDRSVCAYNNAVKNDIGTIKNNITLFI